jgi:hypothetical protein
MGAPLSTSSRARDRRLRRGVLASVSSPVNVGVAAAGAIGAAAIGSWPLAALGGVAYAALVAWDLSSPRFWSRALSREGAAAPVALPAAARLVDPELRAAAEEIARARADLDRVVEETPPAVLAHLGETLASVQELEGRAAALLVRGDALARYLAQAGLPAVRRAVEELEARRTATGDVEARAQYDSALQARRDHLRTLDEIAAALDRSRAHLSRLAALLAGLPPKIVHLRTLDAQAMDRLSGDLTDELGRFTIEIASFEEAIEALAEAPVS